MFFVSTSVPKTRNVVPSAADRWQHGPTKTFRHFFFLKKRKLFNKLVNVFTFGGKKKERIDDDEWCRRFIADRGRTHVVAQWGGWMQLSGFSPSAWATTRFFFFFIHSRTHNGVLFFVIILWVKVYFCVCVCEAAAAARSVGAIFHPVFNGPPATPGYKYSHKEIFLKKIELKHSRSRFAESHTLTHSRRNLRPNENCLQNFVKKIEIIFFLNLKFCKSVLILTRKCNSINSPLNDWFFPTK